MVYIGKRYLENEEIDRETVKKRPVDSKRIADIVMRARGRRP